MRKETALVAFLTLVFIGGAVYTIRHFMTPRTDWAAFDGVEIGATESDVVARFSPRIGLFNGRLEARELGYEPEYLEASGAGAIRLAVFRSGDTAFCFGFKAGKLVWKDHRALETPRP